MSTKDNNKDGNSSVPTTANKRKSGMIPRANKEEIEKRKQITTLILSLNKAGMSATQIGRQIGVSEYIVHRDLQKLRQEGHEIIDYNTIKVQQGKWYKIIEYIRDKLLPHYRARGIKPSLRTIFYRIVADGLILKSDSLYGYLGRTTVSARIGKINHATGDLKFPQLPIDCFADETRSFIDNYEDYSPTKPTPAEEPDDPDEYIEIKETREKEMKDLTVLRRSRKPIAPIPKRTIQTWNKLRRE